MLSVVELFLTKYLLGGGHDYGLSASLSDKWTSSLKNFLTVEQVFCYTTFWTWDTKPGCKWMVVRL
jgi:hypothetical protein